MWLDEKWRVEDKMLDWGGRDDAKLLISATVLLLYMFNVAEMKADERLRRELQADVEEECQKLGPVDSVKVCENHPQGVVLVRLKDMKDAQKCIYRVDERKMVWFFAGCKCPSGAPNRLPLLGLIECML
ncbi:hypothetical protein ACLB2K_049290 [Fragaria x ananassa]